MLAFAIDVQVGVPRFWTGVGIGCTFIASWWLFEPLPGVTLRPSWITLLAGIGGVMLDVHRRHAVDGAHPVRHARRSGGSG